MRDNKGAIDVGRTVFKFEEVLMSYLAAAELEDGFIANAVNGVFDQYKGANINMPALQASALQKMNAVPSNFKLLSQKVGEFVRANASTSRSDGRAFKIGKGKGGGVSRWSDSVAEEDTLDAALEAAKKIRADAAASVAV